MNHIVRLSNGKAVTCGVIYSSVVLAIKLLKFGWPNRDIQFHIANAAAEAFWMNKN